MTTKPEIVDGQRVWPLGSVFLSHYAIPQAYVLVAVRIDGEYYGELEIVEHPTRWCRSNHRLVPLSDERLGVLESDLVKDLDEGFLFLCPDGTELRLPASPPVKEEDTSVEDLKREPRSLRDQIDAMLMRENTS